MLRTVSALLFFLLISTFCSPALSFTCPMISTLDASQRMTTLAKDIRFHNQLYYEKSQPLISDTEYDRLFASLVRLEECFHELVAADSPTRRVGGGVGGGSQKVKHEQPMLSLTSTTGPEAVEALMERIMTAGDMSLLVQPKVDGLPVELIYVAGRLVSASTRGDGRFGEEVTARVSEIQGFPLQLTSPFPDRVVVRGEVYADRQLLQKNGVGSPTGKYVRHPRHVAAGLLQAQNPDPAELATLRLFPFELVNSGSVDGSVGVALRSDRAALQLLSDWGFIVPFEHTQQVKSFAEVQAVYRKYLANRDQQPFAMDGIVVKADDLQLRQRLGAGERAPFWAAAWKFPPDTARTRVVEIRWTVGRTGRRTPVAEVVPVRLGGVQVSRVSLHNAAEIARLDIAAGDQVVVGLVGDVIPQVLEVVDRSAGSRAAPAQVPKQPALDACLHESPVCHNQFLAKANYFVSKSGLNIAGLGRKRMQQLVDAGLVVDLPSLFLLKAEAVASVPGFSTKTARRITAAISAAGHPDSFRLVTALGISGVGPKTLQRLARKFASLDALLVADQDQLVTISTADARLAKVIRSFFQSPGGEELLSKFKELGIL